MKIKSRALACEVMLLAGLQVAACVCLFSLGHAQAIPVDTHVWQLATRYYTPHLKGRPLTSFQEFGWQQSIIPNSVYVITVCSRLPYDTDVHNRQGLE